MRKDVGLPDLRAIGLDALIFDLDGVVTRTAAVWKRLFDDDLRDSADRTGRPFRPFDITSDYASYVDGIYAADNGLPGKPAPDTFLKAAELLGTTPDRSADFEDAIAGIQAGRAGGFALVIAVDRGAGHSVHRQAGADDVVSDLGEFPVE